MIEWLYLIAFELAVLIALLLLLNPFIRRGFGAQVAYWMWLIPLAAVVLWVRPERPQAVMEAIGLDDGGVTLRMAEIEGAFIIPSTWNLEWIWALGILLWSSIRFSSWLRMQNILKSHSTPISLPDSLRQSLPANLSRYQANYFVTSLPHAPFVTGLLQAKIFLPEDFFTKYTQSQQKWILIHELTHIKRKDLWGQLTAEVVRTIFWFNPLVHLASPRFREDQELACDHQALKDCNARDRAQYGTAMLQGMNANLLPATMAFFTLKKERFIMLQKHKKSKFKSIMGASFGLFLAFLALTKAPSTVAIDKDFWGTVPKAERLSMNFVDIELHQVLELFVGFFGKQWEGEPMPETDRLLTLKLEEVPAREAFKFVLGCYGLDFIEHKQAFEIVKRENKSFDEQLCENMLHKTPAQMMAGNTEISGMESKVLKIFDLLKEKDDEKTREFLEKHYLVNLGNGGRELQINHKILEFQKASEFYGAVDDVYKVSVMAPVWKVVINAEEKRFKYSVVFASNDAKDIVDIDFRIDNIH